MIGNPLGGGGPQSSIQKELYVTTLSLISAQSGVPIHLLRKLDKWMNFEEDDFEIDKNHQKALNDLKRKKLTPYVIAYAIRCKQGGPADAWARYENVVDVAKARGHSIRDAFWDVRAQAALAETLPTAKFWVEAVLLPPNDKDAMERIARWCKSVLIAGPHHAVEHGYLASRLLLSLTPEDMLTYPRRIASALNKVAFNGYLDGWHRKEIDPKTGQNRNLYFRCKFDL